MKKGCLGDGGALEALDRREEILFLRLRFNGIAISFGELFISITIYVSMILVTHITHSPMIEIKTQMVRKN